MKNHTDRGPGHRCPRCKKHRSPLMFQKQGQIYQTCSSCRSSSQQQAARERMRETYRRRRDALRTDHKKLPPIPETTIEASPRAYRPSLCQHDRKRYDETHAMFIRCGWIVDANPGIAYCQRHQCATVRDRVEATCLSCFAEAVAWQAATRPLPEAYTEPEREEVFALPAGRPGWKPKGRSKPVCAERKDPLDVWIER